MICSSLPHCSRPGPIPVAVTTFGRWNWQWSHTDKEKSVPKLVIRRLFHTATGKLTGEKGLARCEETREYLEAASTGLNRQLRVLRADPSKGAHTLSGWGRDHPSAICLSVEPCAEPAPECGGDSKTWYFLSDSYRAAALACTDVFNSPEFSAQPCDL